MTFKDWVGSGNEGLIGIGNTIIIPLIFAAAFVVFIWGITNYFFLHVDNEEKRREGKAFIFWGVLGMVLLFSVWGVLNLLLSTLGFSN